MNKSIATCPKCYSAQVMALAPKKFNIIKSLLGIFLFTFWGFGILGTFGGILGVILGIYAGFDNLDKEIKLICMNCRKQWTP